MIFNYFSQAETFSTILNKLNTVDLLINSIKCKLTDFQHSYLNYFNKTYRSKIICNQKTILFSITNGNNIKKKWKFFVNDLYMSIFDIYYVSKDKW